MKKGLVTSPFYPQSREDLSALLASLAQVAAEKQFEVVEFYYEGEPEDYPLIGRTLRDLRLESVFLAGFAMKRDQLDLGAASDSLRQKAIATCIRHIDYSYMCGAGKMLILSGPATNTGGDIDAYLDRFADSVRRLCKYAAAAQKERQLEIVLEFFNNRGEPYLAIGDLATICGLTQRLEDLNGQFGLTFDTSHVVQLDGDLYEYYRELRKFIRHVHFANCLTKEKDSPLFGDRHPPFNIEGGDLTDHDIYKFLQAIDMDNTDICSFEIIPGEIYDIAYCEKSLDISFRTLFA